MRRPEKKRPQEAGAVLTWRAERRPFYQVGRIGARLTARRLRPMVGVRVG